MTINLKIEELDDELVRKYALLYTPFTAAGNASGGSAVSDVDNGVERAVFINNIQVKQSAFIKGK